MLRNWEGGGNWKEVAESMQFHIKRNSNSFMAESGSSEVLWFPWFAPIVDLSREGTRLRRL